MPLRRLKHLNTKECLWVYILRILKDKPMHGYAIRGEIGKRFGFRPGTVTAYKVLYLLRQSGLVKKRTEGRKTLYEITPKGEKNLADARDFYMDMVKKIS